MKKFITMLVVSFGLIISVKAQNSPLKDYLGKYTFAEGSPVAEVDLTLEEDTTLVINSAMGSTQLEKKGVDTFYLAAYDATVIFKRASNNNVDAITILVQGMELIGKKLTSSVALRKESFYTELWEDRKR